MPGRILIAGAAGQLGASMVRAFADRDVVALTREMLDISDPGSVSRRIADEHPEVILNCAAFNDVDGAEVRPTEALLVNGFAVRTLARAAEECGATLVHFGTDFVFGGDTSVPYPEDAPPAPLSTYAMSKLLGEWFALDAPRGFVLRVESLFGSPLGWTGRRGTVDGIVDELKRGGDVNVFTDRIVSPSYIDDVAAATRHLLHVRAEPGIYHCVNSGQATWYEVAAEAARLLGLTPRLRPITMEQVKMKAARPRYCALATGKLAKTGFAMPPWQDALRRWLAGREPSADTMDTHG